MTTTTIKTARKPAAVSRDAQLIRASKTRAVVTAYLSKQAIPVSKAQIESDLAHDFNEIGCDSTSLSYQLKDMVLNERIQRVDAPGLKPTYYVVGNQPIQTNSPKLGVSVVANKAQKPSAQPIDRPQHQAMAQQHMSIDMVKSTGRIRISSQGLTIEIGIVDN